MPEMVDDEFESWDETPEPDESEETEPDTPEESEAEPDADDPPQDEPEEPPEEPDRAELGRRAKKRIDTLTARWKSEQEARLALQAEVDEIRQKLAERESTESEQAFNERLQAAQQKWRAAREDADDVAEQEALDEWLELKAEKKLRANKPKQETPKPAAPNVPSAEQQWQQRNEWFAKGTKPAAQAAAGALYQTLLTEGYDANDPEMYDELDRRLYEEIPSLKPQGRTKPKPSVAAGGRVSPNTSRRNTGRLTAQDLKSMARYGFDPDSPKDRKAWLDRDKL